MMSFDENGDEVNSNQLRVLARVTYTPDSWRSLRSYLAPMMSSNLSRKSLPTNDPQMRYLAASCKGAIRYIDLAMHTTEQRRGMQHHYFALKMRDYDYEKIHLLTC
jgi:hypothetical protein